MEVGQRLFEARRRRGLTLDEISHTTKIPVSLLQAIERDDASRLPQGFFARAFVRTYANEVGVDAAKLLDDAELGEVEEVAADEPAANVSIQEPSSSRSLMFLLALAAACTLFYRIGAQSAPSVPPVTIAAAVDYPQPAAFAPPPCMPTPPAATPVRSVRSPAAARPAQTEQTSAVSPIETSAPALEAPAAPGAAVPAAEPDPVPVAAGQF